MKYLDFPYIPINYEYKSILFISIFMLLNFLTIQILVRNTVAKFIILVGMFLRIGIIIIDNYINIISFGANDGLVFHINGWLGLQKLEYWELNPIKLIVVPSYKMIGEANPLFIVLLNLFCYVLAIIYLYKAMNLMYLKEKKKKFFLLLLVTLSPITALLNVSLLREGFILMFTMLSLYFYIKNTKIGLIFSIIFLLVASYLHSGMIFIIFGYIYYFISIQQKRKRKKNLLLGIFGLIILYYLISNLAYFKGRNLNQIITKSPEEAGSVYVAQANNFMEYIISVPFRFFYFLFSPTPNLFRGIKDIFTFVFNSSIYLYLIISSVKNYIGISKNIKKEEKIFIRGLFLSFLIGTLIYALGTQTSGTAIRHRDKFLFLLVLINYYTFSRRVEQKNYNNLK